MFKKKIIIRVITKKQGKSFVDTYVIPANKMTNKDNAIKMGKRVINVYAE